MEIERLKKKELDEYCESLGIVTKNMKKAELIKAVYDHEREVIDKAIKDGNCPDLLNSKINALADEYASNLDEKIIARKEGRC